MNRIPKAVYTKEFREEAVKLALTEGVGVSEAACRLSIPMNSLANWVRAAKAGKLKTVGQGQKPLTDLEMELNRVKRELEEVKMERDLLKNISRGAPLPDGEKLHGAGRLVRVRRAAVELRWSGASVPTR